MRAKLNTVQLVRAIAIIFILIFHATVILNDYFGFNFLTMAEWSRSGGLDLFFVISGLMIFYINSNKIGSRKASLNFLKKRIIKIFPLYWLATIAGLLLIVLFPQLGDLSDNNLFSIALKSLMLIEADPIVGVAWSLRHIVFFYLVFSLYIAFPKIVKPIIFLWLSLCIINRFEIFPMIKDSFLFSINNVVIWVGVCVGFISQRIKLKGESFFIITGISLYVLNWINYSYNLYSISLNIPIYSLGAFIVMIGVMSIDLKKEVRISKLLSTLGDASFSIFLSHVQFVKLFLVIFDKLGFFNYLSKTSIYFLIVTLTIISGYLVYKVVEKPLNTLLLNTLFKQKDSIGKVNAPPNLL